MLGRLRSWGVGVVVLGLAGGGLPAVAAPADRTGERTVTLITGDKVKVAGGNVTVEPGSGRRGLLFSTERTRDQLYVVPSDVRGAVAEGKLDRRLFDVAGLLRDGFDDRATSSIPLLVTYKGKQRAALPGATATRALPAINGAAVTVAKGSSPEWLTAVGKIWLDGKRQISLDRSVPQIGAPTAWRAGYTGKGVSVAVLDSGIDATHPDLAGRMAGAKNFTADPDGDQVGHGTHVASTIAGSGAASDAALYDGKVCETGGCPESAILAGMNWAATEVRAKVINVSLGGSDTPDVDPLEAAVDRLTEQTGALFVVAAGNEGPKAGTITSPGSAQAALTVGAVDKQDQLAGFSGRGPRAGDGGLKPDVTAPGVAIVAAKARDAVIGDPVGSDYLSLDGTSMATPHVAGAAAILAQQHPAWTAPTLKGALIGSAAPAAEPTAYEQGAGRVDVARGIEQSVVLESGNLSFGTASWPHDDDVPITRTVTYRNFGAQPVTLALSAVLNDPAGNPAADGAIALSANTITVPAGGSVSVQATANTRHDGPDGLYSGRLAATAGALRITAAIGVDKEAERYSLTVKHLGLDGQPYPGETRVHSLDQDVSVDTWDKSTTTLRLPKGEYVIAGGQQTEGPQYYRMVHAGLQLTKDTTIVLDARTTKPIRLTLPRSDARLVVGDVGYHRAAADPSRQIGLNELFTDQSQIHVAQVGPAVAPSVMTGWIATQWGRPGVDGDFRNTPYLYAPVHTTPGRFPTGLTRTVRDRDLARVDQTINATSDDALERTLSAGTGNGSGFVTPGIRFSAPTTTRAFLEPGFPWVTGVFTIDPDGRISGVGSDRRTYRAGTSYAERFNAAPFVPAPVLAQRTQDRLRLEVTPTGDADGNRGRSANDAAASTLLRDGVKVAESRAFGFVEATGLPAEPASYRLETTQTRTSSFSSRTDLTWTFTSAATSEPTQLPLLGVRYRPQVDGRNVVRRTRMSTVPIVIDAQPGAKVPPLRTLTVHVSGDAGRTWHPATITPTTAAHYQATFETPPGNHISLEAHLLDSTGNTTTQTVINAYPLG
ncbi:S8 family serine peptidase [Kribbella sandramycini]|uniref:Subtilisin family serine protease n=1 Tax=Kribbella sandramycini TaxID=60450 RepID=A0A841SED0_9ACTN|nr:subtilisin family serine protease [Kribbella sandramycini]